MNAVPNGLGTVLFRFPLRWPLAMDALDPVRWVTNSDLIPWVLGAHFALRNLFICLNIVSTYKAFDVIKYLNIVKAFLDFVRE